jgi:hypothetical protein
MNPTRKIINWRSLHTLLCWAEWVAAFLCIAIAICGGNFFLVIATILFGGLLGLVWIAHALTLFILQKCGRAKELRAHFCLYLLMIALCVALSLVEAR